MLFLFVLPFLTGAGAAAGAGAGGDGAELLVDRKSAVVAHTYVILSLTSFIKILE